MLKNANVAKGSRTNRLDSDRSRQSEGHWLSAEGDPHDERVSTDLVLGAGSAGVSWDGDRDGSAALVVGSSHGDGSEALAVITLVPGEVVLAIITGHAVGELLANGVLAERDNGPVGKAGELLGNGLGPNLEERHLARLATDSEGLGVDVAEVGLVKHVGVLVEAEQVTDVGGAGIVEKSGEVTSAGGGSLPLSESAVISIAVVVDGSSPAGNDDKTVVSVVGNVGDQGPKLVLAVHEDGASVVTDDSSDTVVHPSLDGISVVETSDGRRDETVGRELGGVPDGQLLHPCNVELDLLGGVGVSGVVERHVGESVGDVHESIAVGDSPEPESKRVKVGASLAPDVRGRGRGPDVGASTKRLLELEGGVNLLVILDGLGGDADALTLVRSSSVLNVTVAVVAKLDLVSRASRQTSVDVLHPGDVGSEVFVADTELLTSRAVDVGDKVDVIDLSAEKSAAATSEETTCHPVDPRVLSVVGEQVPLGSHAGEESHLLTAIEVVDDSGGSGVGEGSVRAGGELSNLLGPGGVGDGGRIVVETLGADTSASLELRSSEVRDIGEAEFLLDASATAATRDNGRVSVGTRVDVEADHANTEGSLVVVELLPLSSSQGAGPVAAAKVVGNLSVDDDTTEVTVGSGGVESRELNTGLGNDNRLERNAIAVQARCGGVNAVGIFGEHKNGVLHRAARNRHSGSGWNGGSRR